MSFSHNILGPAEPVPGLYEALMGNRAARAPETPRTPAAIREHREPKPDPNSEHDRTLYEALHAAGVPPHRLDSGHLVGAANLMAKEGLAPADAYERVVMQSARDSGLVDDADFHDASGTGTKPHRDMFRHLQRLAQTREAARRQETLKLARAYLALAKLTKGREGAKPGPNTHFVADDGQAPIRSSLDRTIVSIRPEHARFRSLLRTNCCSAANSRNVPLPDSCIAANSISYSITSSTRMSIDIGTSSPSAFAVLRLMMSSTFTDCCTGKSAGFSPLRMRLA
jgi:hypothetical protein